MSVFALLTGVLAEEDPSQTHSWILPEAAEIIYGGIASLVIFAMLAKFAGPAVKKAMAARTERIQKELDAAAGDRSAADAEAAQIRSAKGDIGAERERLRAVADEQAAVLLTEGRSRLEVEMSDLEARAEADIAAAAERIGDELRAEIARLSSSAVDLAIENALDASIQQQLVEQFIRDVGATNPDTIGASS